MPVPALAIGLGVSAAPPYNRKAGCLCGQTSRGRERVRARAGGRSREGHAPGSSVTQSHARYRQRPRRRKPVRLAAEPSHASAPRPIASAPQAHGPPLPRTGVSRCACDDSANREPAGQQCHPSRRATQHPGAHSIHCLTHTFRPLPSVLLDPPKACDLVSATP